MKSFNKFRIGNKVSLADIDTAVVEGGAPTAGVIAAEGGVAEFVRTDVAPPVRAAFRAVETLLRGRATVVAACGPGESAEALGLGGPQVVVVRTDQRAEATLARDLRAAAAAALRG